MSRAALFHESDLTRALKAAKKAGVTVTVECEPGKLTVIMNGVEARGGASNTFDELMENRK